MSSYLTTADADAIAATHPATLLSAWNAATDEHKATALELASERFDNAYRYQGRKYDPDGTLTGTVQVLEFPRVAYEHAMPVTGPQGEVRYAAVNVWDWDEAADAAVVPEKVKRAVLYEADSILAGSRNRIQQAIHDGLASQSIGGASESYRDPAGAGVGGAGSQSVLCREADVIARRYVLRSGRLL